MFTPVNVTLAVVSGKTVPFLTAPVVNSTFFATYLPSASLYALPVLASTATDISVYLVDAFRLVALTLSLNEEFLPATDIFVFVSVEIALEVIFGIAVFV